MWDNEQELFERDVEGLQRVLSGRRLTRQRRVEAQQHQERLQPQRREIVANNMAMAMSPDENPLGNNDLHADAEESWIPERDITGEVLGRSREAALRGAAVNVVEAVQGTPLQLADSTRHMNSPASNRVNDVIDRRNAARELWEAAERDPPPNNRGGARPRDRRLNEVFGRGGYMSRSENRLVQSPNRAFNLNDDHGRFLAQRLERQGRLEAGRGENQQELRDLQRRYNEDREGWRRQQDDMMARMQQLQQQLDDMRLQQQQPQPQPQQQPPAQAQPQQAQPPQNQLNVPIQPVPPPVPPQVPPPNVPPPMVPPPAGPPPFNPFLLPPPNLINPPMFQQQVFQGPRVGTPADWNLPPPAVQRQARMITPVGGRTPIGFTPAQRNFDGGRYGQEERMDRRSLKLRTFKGKDVEAWKSLFEDFAEQFGWTPQEKKLQLKANVDDSIRNMFTGLDPETTAEEMMVRLVNRYGVNMTATEVENKLLGIERKPGEDLYSLADRVRTLAHRAHFIEQKRNVLMRQAFFTALRGNSELQHFVNRYDEPGRPDINNTLDIAIEWERRHGTSTKSERVRQVNAYSSSYTDLTRSESEGEASDGDIINKINYMPVREMTTEEGRKLAKHNNEIVSLLRKQAYSVLEEDTRSSSARGRSSGRGRSSYSSNYSRSSSDWSRPRQSGSRDSRSSSQRDWKGRDKRRSSGDRNRRRSRDRFKGKKDGKFDKKKRDSRVNEVREESPEQSDASQATSKSHSDSEQEEE